MARTHEQFVVDIAIRNDSIPQFKIKIKNGSFYRGLDKDMTFQCCNGHPDFVTRPRYIIQKNSGCPLCKSQKTSNSNSKGLELFTKQLTNTTRINLYPLNQQYVNTYTKLHFICEHGHRFITYPKTIISGHGCPQCAKIRRHRTITYNPSTFVTSDVLVQEFNILAKSVKDIRIELIPISQPYDKYRYITQQASSTQPTIFVFEDEWTSNQQLIKKKLKHYSLQNQTTRIHARQCEIKEISSLQKKKLLEENHIQGNDNSQILYGAFYNNILVAVITFTTPRVAVGAKGKTNRTNVWELSRFCTDTTYRIPGIASKLLTHFKRNHQWSEIYSFADRRWSVGNMYEQLGFTLTATNPPSYYYVVNGKRKHRWNYRKDIIKHTLPNYDPAKTEYENMQNHGFYRVWDCGTLKFSMKNENS